MDESTPASRARQLVETLAIPHRLNADIGAMTWFRIGGAADVLAQPKDVRQLETLLTRANELAIPVRVLGSGANLLVRDQGVQGIVVKLDAPAFAEGPKVCDPVPASKSLNGRQTRHITVGAGYDLMTLTQDLARMGLSGLECMAGIPASVGGATRMNAGGAFGEIGPAIASIEAIDLTGQRVQRSREVLSFSYRQSNLTDVIVLSVTFELTPAEIDNVRAEVKRIFRLKKDSQPMADQSAGCCFKNPAPTQPAGKLIDEAGLKGHRVGGAEVSAVHANFVVTHPDATADDVVALLGHIEAEVFKQTGVTLQREVVVWP